MEMFSIASSSKGNSICVGTEDFHILIDAGITFKRIQEGLSSYNLSSDDISAVLVTHEHSDHISGLGVLSRKCSIPIYTTKGTWEGIIDYSSIGKMDESLYNEVRYDERFTIGPLTIDPFRISHDANEPVGYVISCEGKKIAVVTDLGIYDEYIVDKLQNLNAILLEANYDYHMLQVGHYQPWLKRRVHGDMGHLSNEMSGQLLCDIACDNLSYVLLGHMSQDNNYPELAYEAIRCEVKLSDVPYEPEDFEIICAPRCDVSKRIIV
ncbi:MAG: MBL fold metallo-hydrolase [Lachnospiraceae bacterium]|nr:MBL fold metallo-hydrolase [Lachnospiraceae bacterium]